MPIHSSINAPPIFRKGSDSNFSAKKISTMRRPMAPTTPHMMPLMRNDSGSWRQASAMTTALSPPSMMSIAMNCSRENQNEDSSRNSGMKSKAFNDI